MPVAQLPSDDSNPRSAPPHPGAFSAIRDAFAWRARTLLGLHLYGTYTRPLSAAAAEPPPQRQGYSYRIFESADAALLLACIDDPRLDLNEAFVRAAFAKGDACSALFFDGKLICYNWMAFTPTHDARGVYVDFSPKYRYGYKAFTLPEFRGRGLIRLFNPCSDAYCVQRGRDSTIAFIAIGNVSSMRNALHAGSRWIGFAGYLKLGPLFVPFRTPMVRAEGLRFFIPRGR